MNAHPPDKRQGVQGLIGQIVGGRYLVQRALGRGAMGSVFLVEHTALKCPYALKVLHPEVAQHDETVQRFIREAQATASINHPHVCASTDFGSMPDGALYLVMEYLEGQTLGELNHEHPGLPVERAIHITRQILHALSKAHELGIVHRDLKPENIMLIEREGDHDFVKIMDFGLASLATQEDEDERARLTMTGIVYGTPVYMSPEQVRAEAALDGRADLYAIGAMLFEMLTGTIPFVGPNVTALLAQHLTEPVVSIRARSPGLNLPAALDPIIARAMAKKAGDRFREAQEFIDALDAVNLSAPDLTDTGEFLPPHIARKGAASQSPSSVVTKDMLATQASPPPAMTITPATVKRAPDKRLVLIATGVIACLVVVLCAAVVLFSGDDSEEDLPDDPELRLEALVDRTTITLAEERAEHIDDHPLLAKAKVRLDTSDYEGARDMLLAEARDEDAHYHYMLGLAAFGARDKLAGLGGYKAAMALEERYLYDEALLKDVIGALSGPDEEIRREAQMLITSKRLERLLPMLGERAQHISGRKRRVALRDYLVATGKLDELPAWRVASIELRAASGCKAHAEAIKALSKAEDARALIPLRQLDRKPKRGCGKKKRKDCYGCVRDELATAIDILEAKFDVSPSGTSGDDPEESEDVELKP